MKNMKKFKTINGNKITKKDKEYNYQKELTENLDKLNQKFDQKIINEIVLWKTSRYLKLDKKTFGSLNRINKTTNKLDVQLTREILKLLLEKKGCNLPMASTILRFKNPRIYQIIDQRAYRVLYGESLNISPIKLIPQIDKKIEKYLKYLEKLKEVCQKKIEFSKADRYLYNADKRLNGNLKRKLV